MDKRSKYKKLLRTRSHWRIEVESDLILYFPSPPHTLSTELDTWESGDEMHAVKLVLSGSTVFGGWSSVSPRSSPIHLEEPWEMGACVWGTTILVTSAALRLAAPADTLINPARRGR